MGKSHRRKCVFALTLFLMWAAMTTLNNAWSVIFRIGTFQDANSIYPFTFGAIIVTIITAYIMTRSSLTAISLPFAFTGLYELLWHLIPGSGEPMNTLGLGFCISWFAFGCVSISQWSLDRFAILMICVEAFLFGAWYEAGFISTLSIPLNIITKVLMALIFIRVLQVGTAKQMKDMAEPPEILSNRINT
ncbi:MAG: hypothetical protein JRN20_19965 [Nitrososphaerota archaeon]|nr:hypothetical protein [Nitrososphaerota archaeon]